MSLFGDDLSVRISARTGDFERGIDSAGRKLTGLVDNAFQASGALQVLAGRADNAGDEIAETGRRATFTSGAFGALSLGTSGLSLTFGTLSTTLVATLIPALVALSTTLVPLTATLTGLATAGLAVTGAFGAIIGSGILAFGDERAKQNKQELQQVNAKIAALEKLQETEAGLNSEQRDQLENLESQQDKLEDTVTVTGALEQAFGDLRSELVPIIADFGEQFIPLIKDTLNAIPDFVRSLFNAAGDLSVFESALRQLGSSAQRFLPQVVSRLVDLARTALPQVINAGRWLVQNGSRIFEGIIRTTKEVAPLLKDFAGSFSNALPAINRFGTAVLQTLLPALSDGTSSFGDLLDKVLTFARSEAFEKRINNLKEAFNEIKPELKTFLDQLGQIILFVTSEEFVEGLTGFADAALDVINGFLIPAFKDFIEITEIALGLFGKGDAVQEPLGGFDEIGGPTSVPREQSTVGNNMSPTGLQGGINVEVTGDTGVIKDVAAFELDQREQQASGNTGGVRRP